MYQQHFGLTQAPLGKQTPELFDDGQLTRLKQHFAWLLEQPGIGLLTGPAGVGKTAALRHITAELNPHRFFVLYSADTDFSRFDLYRNLALALGLEPAFRRAHLWQDIKERIQDLADQKHCLPVWILDEAQNLPGEFFRDLPAFLNFAFDSKDCMTVWFVAHPQLAFTLSRAPYAALNSRICLYDSNSNRSSNASVSPSSFNMHSNKPVADTPGSPIPASNSCDRPLKADPATLASSCKTP